MSAKRKPYVIEKLPHAGHGVLGPGQTVIPGSYRNSFIEAHQLLCMLVDAREVGIAWERARARRAARKRAKLPPKARKGGGR